LSALVKAALDGEEVVIAKAGMPLVHLVPYQQQQTPVDQAV
jgi:antitoxin (DNA-binding transcriptional repressor) of toxin-antitoxin stability system